MTFPSKPGLEQLTREQQRLAIRGFQAGGNIEVKGGRTFADFGRELIPRAAGLELPKEKQDQRAALEAAKKKKLALTH